MDSGCENDILHLPLQIMCRYAGPTRCWKKVVIIPIFRKVDRHPLRKCRPISPSSIPSKGFESLPKEALLQNRSSKDTYTLPNMALSIDGMHLKHTNHYGRSKESTRQCQCSTCLLYGLGHGLRHRSYTPFLHKFQSCSVVGSVLEILRVPLIGRMLSFKVR